MHLVRTPETEDAGLDPAASSLSAFVGAQLIVLFADGDELVPVRTRGSGSIRLSAGYCMSEDDTYLVLPDDIGEEIVDVFRDGDHELLSEAFDEGLLVHGDLQRGPGGRPSLSATFGTSVTDGLPALPYAASVDVPGDSDPVRRLNTLSHVQCTMVSTLFDEDGLEAVLGAERHLGVSWRPPASQRALSHLSPTFLMSRYGEAGRIGLEMALFVEDEDLIALARPAQLRLPTGV